MISEDSCQKDFHTLAVPFSHECFLHIFTIPSQNRYRCKKEKVKIMNRQRVQFCFLLLLLCLTSWGKFAFAHPVVSSASSEDMVRKVIKEKERAVNQKQMERFLSVIHPEHKMYIQEQKRWFQDAVKYIDAGSFQLKVLSIIPEQENRMRVWVYQSYSKDGTNFTVKYPLLIQRTEQGWKDADIAFNQISDGAVIVRYTSPSLQDQAHIALDTLKKAVYVLRHRFQWSPQPIEVKLYDDPELFRQSVKPSLPKWAGGWHESGQSIKFIGGTPDVRAFASGIVHELTHQMVSELSNDNAAYWLQEGAAMYYERHLLPGLYEEHFIHLRQNPSPLTLMQLEQMNLERLPDRKAYQYYQTCYQLFDYLVEEYGERKIQELFSKLQSEPAIDLDSNQKIKELNQRTRKAIIETFGMTLEDLNRKWREKEE